MALSKTLPDKHLMQMSKKVSLANMKQIGVLYFELEMPEIEILAESLGADMVGINFKIFEKWRNANPGPEAEARLYELLTRAAREGLISPAAFDFLKSEQSGTYRWLTGPKCIH